MPEQLAVARARRDEGAARVPVENQVAGRGHETALQDSAPGIGDLPDRLAGPNVERLEKLSSAAVRRRATRAAAVERLARLPLLVPLRVDAAGLLGEHVEQPRARTVRGRRPVRRAR